MKCDEKIVAPTIRPTFFRNKCEAKWCGVRLQFDARWDLRHTRVGKVLSFIKITVVDIVSITNRPAVILTLLQYIDLVGWHVVTEEVAAHVGTPHFSTDIIDGHEDGVAKSGRI